MTPSDQNTSKPLYDLEVLLLYYVCVYRVPNPAWLLGGQRKFTLIPYNLALVLSV